MFPTSLGGYGNIWRLSSMGGFPWRIAAASLSPGQGLTPPPPILVSRWGLTQCLGRLGWACFTLAPHPPASPAFAGTNWGGPVESLQ